MLVVAGDSIARQGASRWRCSASRCVVAVSLVFLAVGRSEDAERAAAAAPPPEPEPHEGEAARRSRPGAATGGGLCRRVGPVSGVTRLMS